VPAWAGSTAEGGRKKQGAPRRAADPATRLPHIRDEEGRQVAALRRKKGSCKQISKKGGNMSTGAKRGKKKRKAGQQK